jgi:cobalt-zinc-cadmium resistance protein CzcA
MGAVVAWFGRRRALSLVLLLAVALIGFVSLARLPIDAVPDVTNNQVQVVTAAPALGATEVERVVTLPVERGMAGLPGLREVRSISKLGISVVTLVFRDDVDLYFARAQVGERLVVIRDQIPAEAGRPELGPVATGLGEIYQFEVVGPGRSPEELRTILDWTIAPKLRQVPGVTEVVGIGGSRKQFRVTLDPARLAAHGVSLDEVKAALERDNSNAGGGSIERSGEQLVLRAEARFTNLHDIAACVVRTENGAPLTVGMLADVDTGPALRQGALSADGKGETVGGSVLMLRGENSHAVVRRVEAEVAALASTLPEGVKIVPYLNRADFIDRTVSTVVKNLVEGAIVVVGVLLLTLGSLRAGLIVAGAIPFAMLCAFSGLVATGMSANVMSLGAVDFGIIVEGAVVVTEAALHAAVGARRLASSAQRRAAILEACAATAQPVLVSVVIVLLVFLPLSTLQDVEGRMFRPVVVSLVFMLLGAIFWALVVVPALAPAALERFASEREPALIRGLRALYEPLLARALRFPKLAVAVAFAIAVLAAMPAAKTGAEFLPRIFEGNFALDARRPVSVGLKLSIALATEAERALLEVPEVSRVVSRTGRPENAVDPAGPESTDVFVILKPRDEWRPGLTPERLVTELDAKLEGRVPGTMVAFSQPIEMRVNDLIAGVKSDVAVKLFGDDLDALAEGARMIRHELQQTPGAADVKMEVPTGLPTVRVVIDRERASRVGVAPRSILSAVAAARAGEPIGHVYEGERTFDLVLKVGGEDLLRGAEGLRRLPIPTARGELVPLESVAKVAVERDVVQIGREGYRRRLIVESNVRGRDLVGFVGDAKARVAKLELPRGVEVKWGGQFENFTRAKGRLAALLPIALGIIAVMLYAGYRSIALTVVTILSLVFALAGGALGLGARGMPFSIPAAVGFIALAGVAVMSGVVMTTRLLEESAGDPRERVERAARHAFRPTVSTALVAALGFVPMAIATSAGAEVQRPLATVVIAGLLVGVVLSSLAMPAMLRLVIARIRVGKAAKPAEPALATAPGPLRFRRHPKRRYPIPATP